MDRLWTPWRYTYVSKEKPPGGCIFCEKAASKDDERDLVVYRGERNFVLVNLYPYNNGHLLIAPYEHVPTLEGLPEETAAEMMMLARLTETHFRRVYRPQGINLGMNIGECAGAGIADHVHLHILPRWPGDVSFMTTAGETRVIPEDPRTTWKKLSAAFRTG
jgi:ATP adenylyltransferase